LRVLVEDPVLIAGDVHPPIPVAITLCSGPCDEREICPLVTDGRCPLGRFDVVVSSLNGAWGRSVRAAWAETATPVADATELAASDPGERLTHHIGTAIQRLFAEAGTPTG
jgi:hypothetical protein